MFFQLEQTFNSCACGIPQKETFHFGEFLGVYGGILIGYFCKTVNNAKINVFGKNVLTYSLGYVGVDFIFVKNPGFVVFFENTSVSIDSPNFNVRILFL